MAKLCLVAQMPFIGEYFQIVLPYVSVCFDQSFECGGVGAVNGWPRKLYDLIIYIIKFASTLQVSFNRVQSASTTKAAAYVNHRCLSNNFLVSPKDQRMPRHKGKKKKGRVIRPGMEDKVTSALVGKVNEKL